MAGLELPDDRVIDGRNLLPTLSGEQVTEVRDAYFYYRGATLYAVRKGPWKAHFVTEWAYTSDNQRTAHDPPLLFHLDLDPSEQYNVAETHPDIVAEIAEIAALHSRHVEQRPTQLDARIN